ncbi:MAG: MMPL family transporter [Alteromonadaceae bacterium]|nr:MMPL family transporter [Alteromonadaceae bacterium]
MSQISNFRLDASGDTLVLENDADLNFYREIKKKYGSDDFLITTFSPDKNLFNDDSIEQLISLSDLLNKIDGIESVISILSVPLINSPAVSVDSLQKETPTMLSKQTNRNLAKQELLDSPIYRDLLISTDGKTTALLLYVNKDDKYLQLLSQRDALRLSIKDEQTPDQQIQSDKQKLKTINLAFTRHVNDMQKQQAKLISDVRQVVNQFKQYGVLHLGGVPMITADSIAFIQHDLINFGLVVILFIIATLAIAFSRLRWVILPLVTCVITGGVMIGLLGLLNWPVTVVSSNFISLMLILTLSLTIHLIVRYQEYHWQNPLATQLTIVSTVLRTKFVPCLFTSITTIVAFASLIVSDIRPVIDFGWMMTIGVCLAFLMVFTLFPAMLMLLPPGKPVNQQNFTKNLVLFVANKLIPEKAKVLFVYFLIVALSILGVTMLTVENRFIDYFKENTEIYQGMALIDKQLGGTTPLDVIIDAPKDFLDSLNTTEEIGAELLAELDMDEEDLFSFDTDQQPQVITGYWFNPMMLKKISGYHHYLVPERKVYMSYYVWGVAAFKV